MIFADKDEYLPDLTETQGKCHMERFTKNPLEGRHGFLIETTNKDLADEEITKND